MSNCSKILKALFIIASILLLGCQKKNMTITNATKVIQIEAQTFIKANNGWECDVNTLNGWNVISAKETKIFDKLNHDCFVLMTDEINDLILWHEYDNGNIVTSIVESVPTKDHIKYAVGPELLYLGVDNNFIYYGVAEGEVISVYYYEPSRKLFVRYIEH